MIGHWRWRAVGAWFWFIDMLGMAWPHIGAKRCRVGITRAFEWDASGTRAGTAWKRNGVKRWRLYLEWWEPGEDKRGAFQDFEDNGEVHKRDELVAAHLLEQLRARGHDL